MKGALWHVKNWIMVGHRISWRLSFNTLCAYLYLSRPAKFFYKQSQKKHEFILSYLRKELPDIIQEYKDVHEIVNDGKVPEERIIWTLWWQGEEDAPPLVKACINSIRRNANGAKFVVITKDNYRDYIQIPDFILEKRDRGIISAAQLSDIIRYMLLQEHGGLWLDATIYVSQPIPEEYFSYTFYSQHTKWAETSWVQHNAYHGFVVGSRKGAKLASFMKDMFLGYWKHHDTLVDYLLVDYLITLAMQEYPEIKEEIDNLPFSSERLYDLVGMLDKPFEEEAFDKLSHECIFSKLDWHKKYPTHVGKQVSYYKKLISTYHGKM